MKFELELEDIAVQASLRFVGSDRVRLIITYPRDSGFHRDLVMEAFRHLLVTRPVTDDVPAPSDTAEPAR